MAETKLIAAVRPNQGVRRTATHSGVTHIREFQPDRYTIVGNHLAQHRELSLTAIGLAVHILSLPEQAPVDIRTLAARFPEGRDRIAFALRELEAGGYVDRVRERTAGGRVVTRTYAYNAPELTRARCQATGEPSPPVAPLSHDAPTTETARVTPGPVRLPAADDKGPETPVPPTLEAIPEAIPDAVREPGPPRSEHHDTAEALLIGLRRTDDRFTLSRKDVRRLTPAVVAWFDNGAGRAAVHHAMTADVPVLLKSPAGFLAHRLRELLPPPLPCLPERSAVPPADPEPSLPYSFVDCLGVCNRVFRAPKPGLCRDCRNREAVAAAAAATPCPPGSPALLQDTP
jgi:hypothetical protein